MGLQGQLRLCIVTVAQKQKGKKEMKLYLVLCTRRGYFHTFLGFILIKQRYFCSEVGNCYSVVAAAASSFSLPPPPSLLLFLRAS